MNNETRLKCIAAIQAVKNAIKYETHLEVWSVRERMMAVLDDVVHMINETPETTEITAMFDNLSQKLDENIEMMESAGQYKPGMTTMSPLRLVTEQEDE